MSIPGAANPLLLATAAAGGYSISRSLRFNSPDSSFLSRTPASAGNRKTWTWAGWVKRSKLSGAIQKIFTAGTSGSSHTGIQITSGEQLEVFHFAGSYVFQLVTTQVLRDLSAWMHIAVAVDSTQATASNRVKLYVNGSQVTTFSTSSYPATQNADFEVNNTSFHAIAKSAVTAESNYVDGYLADIHFIDGQALTPTSFGEFSATTGVWMPKAYSGTYGTNGFKLNFSDNSTAAALGTDSSGAGNTWTVNNLSVTAGAGNDSLVDVPTNGAQTDTGVGGEVRGNYCTLNPLSGSSSHPLANGNLEKVSTSGSGNRYGTIGITSGKFYWECAFTTVAAFRESVGISSNGRDANDTAGLKVYEDAGTKYDGSSSTSYGASWGANDVLGIAFDADNGTLTFYKNGGSQGTAFTGLAGLTWFPVFRDDGGCSGWINFGQRPFAYTAPSGFKALNTANLPAPLVTKPNTVMDVALYTGNGGNQSITLPGGFNPDLVWVKSRSNSQDHYLFDAIRGGAGILRSNTTGAETTGTTYLSFDTSGFSSLNGLSSNGYTYAGWCWDAGSSTVTNTAGSITSSVRANASAGFSIVTYTGTGSNATVGHGLGVAPSLLICKGRQESGSNGNWLVYHSALGNTKYLVLNATDAEGTSSGAWNNTSPTSTTFSIGTFTGGNSTSGNICYAFAPVAGYSSFGRYTGNGSADGPFVYTGFRPRWIMLKRADSNSSWAILDATRLGYNVRNDSLYANLADAEANFGLIDILSNGFKLRATFGSENGGTHIYAAFAESPFQYARAR